LYGISSATVDYSAARVFKIAVANVLASYSVTKDDITINSYSDSRRRLYEYNERLLTNSLQVSYTIYFGAQKAGFTDTSSAASAIIGTLKAAVQSSVFNNALATAAADPNYGSSVMLSVTSSSTITATDATTDSNQAYEAYRAYQIKVAAIAVILTIFFFCISIYITVFYAVHKRCPRPGRPVLNPCAKEVQTPTSDTKEVYFVLLFH